MCFKSTRYLIDEKLILTTVMLTKKVFGTPSNQYTTCVNVSVTDE